MSKHMASIGAPLRITLEFARAEDAGDPYAFRFVAQDYLLRSEGGSFKTGRLQWDDKLLSDLAALRRPHRDPAIVQRVGETLRRFLSATKWARDEDKIVHAIKGHQRVILTLRSAAAELYALPWELLTLEATGQHIGELPGTVLRYEWPETQAISGFAMNPQPRVLFAWSAAAGAVPAAEHHAALRAAYQKSPYGFDPDQDVLAHASLGKLSQALLAATKAERPISILHLLCHGGKAGSTFGLALQDEDGTETVVADAGRLRQILALHAGTLRLIVLAACDSGNSGDLGNQLGSVAQALHRAGIAAVVASRYPLSVAGSIRFAEAFYPVLLKAGHLEAAILAARHRLAEDAAQLDWASLQLYAHGEELPQAVPKVNPSAPRQTLSLTDEPVPKALVALARFVESPAVMRTALAAVELAQRWRLSAMLRLSAAVYWLHRLRLSAMVRSSAAVDWLKRFRKPIALAAAAITCVTLSIAGLIWWQTSDESPTADDSASNHQRPALDLGPPTAAIAPAPIHSSHHNQHSHHNQPTSPAARPPEPHKSSPKEPHKKAKKGHRRKHH